ncbi:uncharacterized protein LOC125653144 [Ostrea edulis]|uniref:uncharacterized protein LOC125653144 n=1 Tax=Ostrea edulis TaxID=37623 RepID=UPI002095F1A4|nr:uncharacterized protein LOC125653144 [Ostrea edulis]XP_056008633.1 uncharacterized protein LOC125653144 [Ostrea edulis]
MIKFTRKCFHIKTSLFHRNLTTQTGRKKLVILGTGWGGYSLLRNIDKKVFDVVVISPRNYFLFTPLLASTTVGTLEFRSIIEPVRNVRFRQTADFHLSYATKVDRDNKVLHCESVLQPGLGYTLNYDKLVLAVGARSNTFNVPGVEEHAFFLKDIPDARKIRNRIIQNIELSLHPGLDENERKRLLNFVIVGGGPTGVEFGAELYDWIEQDVARVYHQRKDQVHVTLVESNQILSSFDERLRHFAEKKIKERDRFKLVKSSVTRVTSDCVKLSNGEDLPCGLVVWSTGLSPTQFVKSLDVQKNKSGQILTDKYLHVIGDTTDSVYALGDCADIKDNSLPCIAQVAERQGEYVANLLCGKADKEFTFQSKGMLAYVGHYQGVSDIPNMKMQGITSWFLWRSAYLTKLGSWRLRMQVPMDWTKAILFGRDISRFD